MMTLKKSWNSKYVCALFSFLKGDLSELAGLLGLGFAGVSS